MFLSKVVLCRLYYCSRLLCSIILYELNLVDFQMNQQQMDVSLVAAFDGRENIPDMEIL